LNPFDSGSRVLDSKVLIVEAGGIREAKDVDTVVRGDNDMVLGALYPLRWNLFSISIDTRV